MKYILLAFGVFLCFSVMIVVGSGLLYQNSYPTEPTTSSYSPCVDTDRIACVPEGGRYNMDTKEVLDAYGNVVSTKEERVAKWQG